MKHDIQEALRKAPGLKAKEIAKQLGITRTEVNQILYADPDTFKKQGGSTWALAGDIVLTLMAGWVTASSFEQSLQESGHKSIAAVNTLKVVLPDGCCIMLDAAARLLALMNQLAFAGKNVVLDFSRSNSTRTYLSRAGFFDLLDLNIDVIPSRPKVSMASVHKGNSEKLVEFDLINPESPDEDIPQRLKDCFVGLTSREYSGAAFTIFAELCNNVCRHSETKIPGFAALQKYKGRAPHIQTIVSDSGLGISTTLRRGLKQHYPHIYRTLDLSSQTTDIDLIVRAFREGSLSQFGPGNGSGLHRSNDYAVKFNADVSIRQSTLSLILKYRDGILVDLVKALDLPEINGTHVCFDFSLTNL